MTEFFASNPWVGVVLKPLLIFGAVMTAVPLLVYFERRICGWIQDRKGPNRVGPFGLLQPLADVVKLLFKEDIAPRGADRVLYALAPVLVVLPAILSFAVIPVGIDLQILDVNSGVIFTLTIGSFAVYGLAFGGWASSNKYSLLGGLRSSAQMISYESALFLALIAALISSNSLQLGEVVRDQLQNGWNLWRQPLACVLFLVAAFAETNRLPFDLPECESELVGGYHTEYSSMKFALFFLGEYIAMVTMAALFVTVFLGGWSTPTIAGWVPPGMAGAATGEASAFDVVCSIAYFGVKTAFILFFYIWVRWTLPRFRYDQLMRIGWKAMIPLALVNLAVTCTWIVLAGE